MIKRSEVVGGTHTCALEELGAFVGSTRDYEGAGIYTHLFHVEWYVTYVVLASGFSRKNGD
jgi:hypothetical protein